MKALRIINQKPFLDDVEKPTREPGQSLLRVTKAGICNTDLEIIKGYMDYEGTLGHEFVATVEESDQEDLIGKRVVADINFSCGKCETCLAGEPHHCPHRTVLGIMNQDGAFAEYLVAPDRNLVVVPDTVSDEKAVFAEPLAAALEIQEQLQLKFNEPICVLGDGKLGLLIALSLSYSDYDVTLVGRHPERLPRLGDGAVNFATHITPDTFSVIVEATGNPEGLKEAIRCVKPRGTVVLKSTYEKGFDFNPALLVINEVKVLGSRCGPMQKAIDLMENTGIDPSTLIDKEFNLSDGLDALKEASKKRVVKVLLNPQS